MQKHKTLRLVLTGALLVGLVSPAAALDAWRDRRGLFYGAGLGFGVGKADVEGAENEVAVSLRGRVGGGIVSQLTLDGELGYGRLIDPETDLVTGMVGINFFPIADQGLYLRGFFGIGHISPESGSGETGLGVGGGLGYEFFANADMAVGVGADFQQHFYDQFDFQLISFNVTPNVY